MSLIDTIKLIQGIVGVKRDGVFGPLTAAEVLRLLQSGDAPADVATPPVPVLAGTEGLDDRTVGIMASLDPKAVPVFAQFMRLAKATAATMGCDYRLISGNRSWEEQTALYELGRSRSGKIVTNARAGYSWHNFGVAADAGVFQGSVYLDGGSAGQAALAERVHKASSVHAVTCGLTWGGSWKSIVDTPHYQMGGLPDSPTEAYRQIFRAEGSVL